MKFGVSGIFFITLFVCLWLIPFMMPQVRAELPVWSWGSVDQGFVEGDMLFVGDIMLGRHVEGLITSNGSEYPFLGTKELLASTDVTIGNFEAAAPQKHKRTEDFNFVFSVNAAFFNTLKEVGFDSLSVANNHTYDFGNEGYIHTVEKCYEAGLMCFGHPYEVRDISVGKQIVGESVVGILYLHALIFNEDDPELQKALTTLFNDTDFQIVYVHWGIEYEPIHDDYQREVAEFFIDEGVDTVIGHHPHVVQDIELYKNKPIFYSLGNFVFDQYFNEQVETGLAVKLSLKKNAVNYTLIPVSSSKTKSQPHIMSVDAKAAFLSELIIDEQFGGVSKSDPVLVVKR